MKSSNIKSSCRCIFKCLLNQRLLFSFYSNAGSADRCAPAALHVGQSPVQLFAVMTIIKAHIVGQLRILRSRIRMRSWMNVIWSMVYVWVPNGRTLLLEFPMLTWLILLKARDSPNFGAKNMLDRGIRIYFVPHQPSPLARLLTTQIRSHSRHLYVCSLIARSLLAGNMGDTPVNVYADSWS